MISRPFTGEDANSGEQTVARNLYFNLEREFDVCYTKRGWIRPTRTVLSLVFYDWIYPLYLALINIFKRYRVVVFASPFQGALSSLYRLGGSRTVVPIQDTFFIDNGMASPHDRYSSMVYRLAFLHADVVIATSAQTRGALSRHFGVESTVILNGLSREFDCFSVNQLEEKEATWDICYVGAYCKVRKRINFCVDLLNANDNPKLRFHFAGPITDEFILELETRRIPSLSYHVYGTISEREKVELFNRSSFLYSPTALEGTGLQIVEALRAGVIPIVHLDAKIPQEVKHVCEQVGSCNEALELVDFFVRNKGDFRAKIVRNYQYSMIFDYGRYVDYIEDVYDGRR